MKNGFSLIELIVVIAILAGISLLVYPKVNDIIDESRIKSNLVNVKKIVEAAKEDYTENYLNKEVTYNVNDGLFINSKKINTSNSIKAKGNIYIDEYGKTTYYIYKDKICYYKHVNENYVETSTYEQCTSTYQMD